MREGKRKEEEERLGGGGEEEGKSKGKEEKEKEKKNFLNHFISDPRQNTFTELNFYITTLHFTKVYFNNACHWKN